LRFTIEIESDSEAFDTDDKARRELQWMLHEVLSYLEQGYTEGSLLDSNGNTSGQYSFERTKKYDVTRTSELDQKLYTMELPVSQDEVDSFLMARSNGRAPLVQDAFPDLSAPEREFIINGILPDIWDEQFKLEDD
jgi:hypothetical protein